MSFDTKRALEIVDKALEISPDERPAYLDSACQDSSLRQYVESLLSSYQQADDFLRDPALMTHASVLEPEPLDSWLGRRLGPYQLIEEIGQGGMGAVYRAVRADDQYQKQVAVKLVRTGFETRFAQARFRSERQILATLEHPNIARLLDGGTADDGSPYFVMELVEGIPIHEYCDAHRLSITERLRLFLTVCSAIQYAHQSLVVHRDLKPANILVTSEGVPKLLDFGIAKILDASAFAGEVEPTIDFLRMLTPEYASPEQVRGEAISTASDVYSLGVVLYLLLTGHRPYKVDGLSTEAMRQAVCETEPARPSVAVLLSVSANRPDGSSEVTLTPQNVSSARDAKPEKLSRALAGDLDNVVLKSLHKEPRRRYASVEQLSEDIRRYMEGLPVGARPDTLLYRAGKFVKRNTVPVVAAALLLLSLCGGLVATLWEAHIARVERAKAERRFNDVREVANSLMFEIHDGIKDLPGATPVRNLLVGRALHYLDSLSQESAGDPSLQRELAAAYERVGNVQSDPDDANLGDVAGALKNFRKALAIRESLSATNPTSVELQRDVAGDYKSIGRCLGERGDQAGAVDNLRKALSISEKVAAGTTDPTTRDMLAGDHYFVAIRLEKAGNLGEALKSYQRAASIHESIRAAKQSENVKIQTHLAGDYEGMARVLMMQHDAEHGETMHAKGLAILSELYERDPTNATVRSYLGMSYAYFGDLVSDSDPDRALQNHRQQENIFRALTSADPSNILARRYLGFANQRIAALLIAKGSTTEGLKRLQEALSIFNSLPADGPKNVYVLTGLTETYIGFGAAYAALAANARLTAERQMEDWRQARFWYQKGLDIMVERQNAGTMEGIDRDAPKSVAKEIAKCDAALANFGGTTDSDTKR